MNTHRPAQRLLSKHWSFAILACAFVGSAAAIVLLGWMINAPALVQLLPGSAPVSVAEAAGLLLASSVLLMQLRLFRPWYDLAATGLSILLLLFGLFTITEFMLAESLTTTVSFSRTAPPVALNFALLGSAFLLRRYPRWSWAFAFLSGINVVPMLLGPLMNTEALPFQVDLSTRPFQIVVAFLLLSVSTMASAETRAGRHIGHERRLGDRVFAQLMITGFILPPLTMTIAFLGQQLNLLDVGFYLPLMVFAQLIVYYRTARSLNRIDEARNTAEAQLKDLNLSLEQKVQERTAALEAEICERRAIEQALRYSEDTLLVLFDLLPVGVSIVDKAGRIVQANAAAASLLKIYHDNRLTQADGSAFPIEQLPAVRAIREQRTIQDVEIGLLNDNEQPIWANVSAAPLPIPDLGAVIVTTDITQRKRAEQQLNMQFSQATASNRELKKLATTDGLTGLLNRRAFQESIEHACHKAIGTITSVGLILIDIDHFKQINDRFGHQLGDEVLTAVARLLRLTAREEDVVARYGGEEFAIVLRGVAEDQIAAIAERYREAILHHTWEHTAVTVSCGATVVRRSLRPEQLIAIADEALYTAKRAGRNRVEVQLPLSSTGTVIRDGL